MSGTWGWYGSIYVWLLVTGIGIPPIPEEAGIIYAASVTATHSDMHWWLAWPIASLGILSADTVLYLLGRWLGRPLLETRWVKHILKPRRRKYIEDKIRHHGWSLLLSARLLPPLRTGVYLIAGVSRFPFLKFLLADGCYLIVGVGILYWCSHFLVGLIHHVGRWSLYAGAGFVVLVLLYFFYRYLHGRESRGYHHLPAVRASTALVPYRGNGDGSTNGTSSVGLKRTYPKTKTPKSA